MTEEPGRPALLAPDLQTETVVSYRSVSRWAVIAFALGLLSIVAFFSMMLWWIPLVTVVVGIVALRRTSRPDLNLAGRSLAAAAIVLALFFTSAAAARMAWQRAEISRQAVQFADQWLQRVQRGELLEAHHLTIDYFDRRPSHESLRSFYSADHFDPTATAPHLPPDMVGVAYQQLVEFYEQPPISELKEHGEDARWKLLRCLSVSRDRSSRQQHNVLLEYQLSYPEGGEQKQVPMYLTLQREAYPDLGEAHWSVRQVRASLEP